MAARTQEQDGAAQAAPNPLDLILQNLQALNARIGTLEDQVQQTRSSAPQFVPMQPPRPKGMREQLAGMQNGEMRKGVSKQVFVDKWGDKLPASTLQRHPIRFQAGDYVRLNLASSARFDGERTWGDVVSEKVPGFDGVGVVTKIGWLDANNQWKYYVHFPGLTSREHPDGFRDDELLPAA